MKSKVHSMLILLFALAAANTFGQIPNSGFENWTNFGTYMEANGWSSANTISAGSFYPVTRAADPYPAGIGNYSIRIENNTSMLPNWEAYGFAWNNSITSPGPKPAFPVTGHPNSLTGYYKWFPQNGDTMYINIILFLAGATIQNGQMIATAAQSNWTSFNIPIGTYATADSATIMLAAFNADGPLNVPYGNSVLFVDNLNFDSLITIGVSAISKTDKISVYPDPFSTQTILQTDILLKNTTLTVDNCFGQTVKQIINISGQTITLHRDDLPSGLYFLRLTEDRKVIATKKLLITD